MNRARAVALAGVALTAAGLIPATPATAAPTVVMSGLDNPRGVAVAPNGRVFVAETGAGGDECREIEGPQGLAVSCFGRTGRVSVLRDGVQQVKTVGFPSEAAEDGGFAVGLHDVVIDPTGRTFVVVGGQNPPSSTGLPLDDWGSMLRATRPDGRDRKASLEAHEAAHDPDGNGIESNAYGMAALADGTMLVADAAANALLHVTKTGEVTTLAVFPDQALRVPVAGLPTGPESPMPIQSVPTSVAVGPDGAFYVGELTGFPFVPGYSRVWRVVPGETPTVFADGFTAIIDLTFGPDGSLYVLQLTKAGVLAGEFLGLLEGALYKVQGGPLAAVTKTEIAKGALTAPGGVAISPDGTTAYVTNKAISAGEGELLAIPL